MSMRRIRIKHTHLDEKLAAPRARRTRVPAAHLYYELVSIERLKERRYLSSPPNKHLGLLHLLGLGVAGEHHDRDGGREEHELHHERLRLVLEEGEVEVNGAGHDGG